MKRGHLDVPIIGVAKAGWNLDQLRARARDSLEAHGAASIAPPSTSCSSLLRYVDGDYQDPATFDRLRQSWARRKRPLHYLAIPQSLFSTVVEQLARSGCARGGRVVAEKPFGRDLDSARALNRSLLAVFPETAIFRIDHFLGKEPVQNLLYFRFGNSLLEPHLEPQLHRQRADHDGRAASACEGRGKLLRADGRHPGRHPEPPPAGDGDAWPWMPRSIATSRPFATRRRAS